jgi:hypothetical protein
MAVCTIASARAATVGAGGSLRLRSPNRGRQPESQDEDQADDRGQLAHLPPPFRDRPARGATPTPASHESSNPGGGKDREHSTGAGQDLPCSLHEPMDRIGDRPQGPGRRQAVIHAPAGRGKSPTQAQPHRRRTTPSSSGPGPGQGSPLATAAVRDRRLGPEPPCRRTCQQVGFRNACRRFSAEFFGQSNRPPWPAPISVSRAEVLLALAVARTCGMWRRRTVTVLGRLAL